LENWFLEMPLSLIKRFIDGRDGQNHGDGPALIAPLLLAVMMRPE